MYHVGTKVAPPSPSATLRTTQVSLPAWCFVSLFGSVIVVQTSQTSQFWEVATSIYFPYSISGGCILVTMYIVACCGFILWPAVDVPFGQGESQWRNVSIYWHSACKSWVSCKQMCSMHTGWDSMSKLFQLSKQDKQSKQEKKWNAD